MKRILKTTVPVDDHWHEIPGGTIVHVAEQAGEVTVWFEDDTATLQGQRTVRVFGTGQPLPEEPTEHVGTVVTRVSPVYDASFVWHLREKSAAESVQTIRIDVTSAVDPAEVGRQILAHIRAYEARGGW